MIRKKTVLVSAVAVVMATALSACGAIQTMVGGGAQSLSVETYVVEKGDIKSTVDVTGIVESRESTNVYTTLSYPVKELAVEVGDVVQEGDFICKLDTDALENTIAQQSASVYAAQQKANYGLAVAEKDLETVKFNAEKDYDSALLQAEAAVKSAETALTQAEHDANSARKDLRDARDEKKEASDENFVSYDSMISSYERKSIQADLSLDAAQQRLEDAKAALRSTKMLQQEKEISSKDAVKNAELNTNFSDSYIAIEGLRKDLAKSTITAPVSGTVTAVYTKEGASPSASGGLIIVIEDTKALKITTKVKEYDIGNVKEGLSVVIKSDAMPDQEFEGKVSMIAPTTNKDAAGNTVDTTNAEFKTEVEVTSGSDLRIGMNARLNIITDQKNNVIFVPYDSVTSNAEGEDIVFVMRAAEPEDLERMKIKDDGVERFVAKQVPVTVGMETDFFSEILSSELQEGDKVIVNPEGLEDSMLVEEINYAMIEEALQEE